MWRLRMGALIASGLLGLVLTSGAWAAGGGNSGDVSTPAVTRSSGDPVITSISAVTVSRPRRPAIHRHGKPVHPARHRRIRRRHVKAARAATPPFTG
jgi:hypothetical protein